MHDFGIVAVNSSVSQTFRISNNSECRWLIKEVRQSCSCTAGHPSKLEIEAGKQIDVDVKYNTPSKASDDERAVTLELSGRHAPRIHLVVRANVREPMTILPRRLTYTSKAMRMSSRPQVFSFRIFPKPPGPVSS